MKKIVYIILAFLIMCSMIMLTACNVESVASGYEQDKQNTITAVNNLQENQPTPKDLDYSLERYNLIRRAYWVNGQREKANILPCEIEKPLGYVVLFSGSVVLGNFVVDGKVSSLNSFLTPDSEYYEMDATGEYSYFYTNDWIADIDGSYGSNDNGIFFFTTEGKYIEWNGNYLYSDIPFIVDSPVLNVGGVSR